MDLSAQYSRPILVGSAVIAAINLGSTFWLDTVAFPPWECLYASTLTLLILLALFLLHTGFALFWKGQRKPHLIMTVVVATAICGLLWIPMVFGNGRERWFLETGEREFTQTIDSVVGNRLILTAERRRLNDTYPNFQVYGETNLDGTYSIFFYDKTVARGPHGYLYYSGEWKEQKDGSKLLLLPNSYKTYSHLTNHWYRF
jgi:hypothetical protein